MNKYKIVNRFRFYTAISLILIAIFASMLFVIVNAKSTSNEILVPVYISYGDNLWNLSAKYADSNTDIRNYIHKVMDINNLKDATLHPGDVLMFPQSSN